MEKSQNILTNSEKILVRPKKSSSLNFGLKIRKNAQNSEKYSGNPEKYYWEEYPKSGKILKIWENTLKIQNQRVIPKKRRASLMEALA